MNFWIQLAILVVTTLLSKALAPKPPKQKPATLDDFEIPTAEEGRPIPVAFGTNLITGPNVVWYGDLGTKQKTKNGVKTRKYWMGLHFAVHHGPADAFLEVRAGDRTAWSGEQTASGQILIDARELFGGEKKEGGLYGYLDVMMGEAAQTANSYLSSVQGTPQPAYRGVLGCVYRKGYIAANSPYVKPWAFKTRRILEGWYGGSAWQPDLAEIFRDAVTGGPVVPPLFHETWDDGFTNWELAASPYDNWDNLELDVISGNNVLRIYDGSPPSGITRSIDGGNPCLWISFRFYIESVGTDEVPMIGFGSSSNPHIHFSPAGEESLDASRRPRFYSFSGSPYVIAHSAALSTGVWYRMEITRDGAGAFDFVLLLDADDSVVNAGTGGIGGSAGYDIVYFVNQGNTGSVLYDDIIISSEPASDYAGGDMNPAHIIYEAITNPHWGMGYPSALIDDTNFTAAAQTFYDEACGLSLLWNQESTIEEFIQEIVNHCGAVFGVDPRTGQFTLKPIRYDYTPAALPVFDESEIIAFESFERAGYGELVGEVTVVYTDRQTHKDAAVTVQNLATVQSQSGVVAETVRYPGIRGQSLAQRTAMRDLKAKSTALARGRIRVNRTAWDVTPGDVIKVSWAKLGLSEVICRVTGIDTGTLTDGVISVDFAEDVFGLPSSTYAAEQSSGWTEPDTLPDAVSVQVAMEVPYWYLRGHFGGSAAAALASTAGYGWALGVDPSGASLGFDLWGQVDSGGYVERAADANFTSRALLNGTAARDDTTLVIDTSELLDAGAAAGDLLLIVSGTDLEIVRLAGGDLTASIDVTRGHLDTTPQELADNAVVWLLPSDLVDTTEYSDAQVVDYKLLTIAGEGTLAIGSASATSVTMDSRQVRPIPPGNLLINGDGYPITITDAFTVTWEHRDRLSHADTTLQTATGITSEAGVTYNGYAYDDDTSTLLDSASGISGLSWAPAIAGSYVLRLEIESERDGYVSWQRQVRVFDFIGGMQLEDGSAALHEDGSFRDLE